MSRPAGDSAATDPIGRPYPGGHPLAGPPPTPSWVGEPWPEPPSRSKGRRRAPWLLLLGLVVLGLVLWGFARHGSAGAPEPRWPASGASGHGSPNGHPTGAPAGALSTAGGAPILPLTGSAGPGGELTALAGADVAGTSLQVLSAPTPAGFWVGNSNADRVWVEVAASDQPPVPIRTGDLVDLSGELVGHGPDFAAQRGIDATAGADQLTRQGAHVRAQPDQIRPVGEP